MKKKKIYDFFNIDEKSSEEEIKKAYRKKSKETHPDLNGEDKRPDFEKANFYYMILTDAKRKAKYDEDGTIDDEKKLDYKTELLCKTFVEIISRSDVDFSHVDLVEKMVGVIEIIIGQKKEMISNMKISIENTENIKKRIKSNKDSNIFINLLNSNISMANKVIEYSLKDMAIAEESIEELKNYSYDFDDLQGLSFSTTGQSLENFIHFR